MITSNVKVIWEQPHCQSTFFLLKTNKLKAEPANQDPLIH